MMETDWAVRPLIDLARPPGRIGPGAALFLDFDGTLVAIASRPDAIEVPELLRDLLRRLARRLEGRLAIVSGRALDALDSLLALPEIAVSGSHGAELRWPDGMLVRANRPAALDVIIEQLTAFVAQRPGTLVEEKPVGVALHHRGAPEASDDCAAIMHELSDRHGLAIQYGKMVHELLLPGRSKGDAVRAFMSDTRFSGSVPVFVGDDLTDEEGFAAVAGFGGIGVLVGEPRDTAAQARLNDVAAVHAWLAQIADGR